MGMEAVSSMRTPRARNASFDHARRYTVIAGQLFRGRESFGPAELAARPLLSISAFRAKFGLRVIWLSEVRAGGLFRVATPLVPGEPPGGGWLVGFSPLQFSVPKGTGETGDWRNTSDLGAAVFSSCLQFVASHWRVISSSLKNGSSGVGLA